MPQFFNFPETENIVLLSNNIIVDIFGLGFSGWLNITIPLFSVAF